MESLKGTFEQSLTRNNSQIKKDRAVAISEDTSMAFKRRVEDLEVELKRARRAREAALDLSPDSAMGLRPARDFDPLAFVDTDLELTEAIRNLEIRLVLAKARYRELFVDGTPSTDVERSLIVN